MLELWTESVLIWWEPFTSNLENNCNGFVDFLGHDLQSLSFKVRCSQCKQEATESYSSQCHFIKRTKREKIIEKHQRSALISTIYQYHIKCIHGFVVVKVDRFNKFVKIIVIIIITIIIIMIIIMIMTLLLLFFSHPMCYSLIKPNPSLEFEKKYFRCNCWSFISLFLVFTVKRFCFGIKRTYLHRSS